MAAVDAVVEAGMEPPRIALEEMMLLEPIVRGPWIERRWARGWIRVLEAMVMAWWPRM